MDTTGPCTAFDGNRKLASGTRLQVALAVKSLLAQRPDATALIFDDSTGSQIDFNLQGSDAEIAARLAAPAPKGEDAGAARGPGRPKLGVVPREVTLLPRHWEWLAAQPGGASVTLRKLVEEARRAHAGKDVTRASQERAYRFMAAMAGNLPNFEEAARALFASNQALFGSLIADWPADVRGYASELAGVSNEAV
jgi:uncharacterized protein